MVTKGTRGIVYFCPELRLYRYKCRSYEKTDAEETLGDESDLKFDADELEDVLVAQLATGDERSEAEANFVSYLTGLGRKFPHKIVKFDTGVGPDGKIDVLEPEPFWNEHDKERVQKEAEEEK